MNKILSIAVPIAIIGIVSVLCAVFIGIAGALSVALMGILTLFIIKGMICDRTNGKNSVPHVSTMNTRKLDYLYIILFVIIVRLGTYIFAHLSAVSLGYVKGNILDTFAKIWINNRTDAPHYINIAKRWYVTHGDAKNFIVFFPLFPIMLKAFYGVFGDYASATVVLNLLLSFGIGITAYELCLLDFDRKTAFRFVKYVFIIPATFFYAAPMTESLFVLLCLLCLYYARRGKFLPCALFGALAAFTRSQGVILILPCAYMALSEYRKSDKCKTGIVLLFKRCSLCLCIGIGLIGYLYINYSVWGNPMQFSVFQWEYWHQKLGFFGSTVQMIWEYFAGGIRKIKETGLLKESFFRDVIALWLPQLIYVFAAPIIVLFATIKSNKISIKSDDDTESEVKVCALNPAYGAYFAAYFIISVGATWLLSAPRYLMACITLPLCIAVLTKHKSADTAVTIICCILGAGMLMLFSVASPIF